LEQTSDLLKKQKTKLATLKNNKIDLFPNDFIVSHTVQDIKNIISVSPDPISEDDQKFTDSEIEPVCCKPM
jgi:lysyl-tRNA synthetase class 2